MAVPTTKQLRSIRYQNPVYQKLRLDRFWANVDLDTGDLSLTPDITGTDSTTYTINAEGTDAKTKFNTNSATGNFTYSILQCNLTGNRSITYPEPGADGKFFAVSDNANGSVSTAASTGTTNTTFEVDSGTTHTSLILSAATAGSTGKSTTIKAASAADNYVVTAPDPGNNTSYLAYTDQSDGSVVTTASTGTTGDTFTVASGESDGTFILSVGAGGTNHSVTLIASVTTQAVVLTLPDVATDTVCAIGATQTLVAKTLTDPTINAATLTGNITITTPVIIGTWANLGNVTTVNINGGTADSVVIGGSTPAAITGTTITGTTITDGTISINTGAITGALDISGATVTYDWDGVSFTGAIAKDTDLVMVDDNGTKKEATYQVLMDGVNDLGAYTGTVVPGTDTVLIDDGGVAKSATYQVFMDGLEDLAAAGAGAVVADKLTYLDGGVAENITVQNLFNVSDLAATVGPIAPAADELILQDAGVAESCTYQEFMNGVNDLTALAAAPDLTDSVLADDGGTAKKLTVQFLLDAANSLAADAVADGDSFMLIESGGVSKKEAIADLATLFAGTGLTAASSVLAVTKPEKVTFMFPGTFSKAGDFHTGGLAGLDAALDITATEATNTYCKSYNHDNTKFANLDVTNVQGEWTNAYQLFPDAEAENDACYFAADVAFCELWFDINTVATYNGAAASQIWEYSQGSSGWATLTLSADTTDVGGAALGQQPFGSDGCITFVPPVDWAVETVDSLADKYWVRCRCTAAVDITQIPTMDNLEHHVVTPTDGAVVPFKCNVYAIRATDGIVGQMHTTNDVKMVFMNFTKGTYSLELTWSQDKRTDRWTTTALKAASAGVDCDAGDVVGFLCTQEDGAQDITNAVIELDVTPLA